MKPAAPRACPKDDRLEEILQSESCAPVADSHVESCPRCQFKLTQMRENDSFLGVLRTTKEDLESGWESSLAEAADIDGYRLLSEIHSGGQGVVYKALQIETKRTVAVKIMLRGVLATERQRRRFEREIEIAASLRHPNIVTLYERADLPDGRLAFSMEYIRGQPIDDWIRDHLGRESCGGAAAAVRAKIQLFLKVCDAVQFAHQRGIIHRDLKPDNILVDEAGEPRVLDFGLAKEQSTVTALQATRTEEFVGTLAYAAPEQILRNSAEIDTRADVYSLGVLLYHLLSGCSPYPVNGPITEVIRNVTKTDPLPMRTHDRSISGEVDTIVLKALSKEPDRRYRSAGALQKDLEHFLKGEPIDARRDSTWYLLRKTATQHGAIVLVIAAFVILISAFVISQTISYRQTQRRLRASNIERGRAQVTAGDLRSAEDILWREHLTGDWGLAAGTPLHRRESPLASDSHWALWELYRSAPCLAMVQAHEGAIASLVFYPGQDSKFVTLGFDGDIVHWDGLDAPAMAWARDPLGQHLGGAQAVRISAGGTHLATMGAGDGKVRIWDVSTRREIRVLDWEVAGRSGMAFSPDGWVLAAALKQDPKNRLVMIRDLGPQVEIQNPDPGARIVSLSFSADGSSLLLGTDRSIWRVRVDGTDSKLLYRGTGEGWAWSIDVDPSGTHFFLSTRTGTFLYDLSEGEPGVQPTVGKSEFTRDGQWIVERSSPTSVKIRPLLANGGTPISLLGHTARINNVVIAPGGRRIVTTDAAGLVRAWNLPLDSAAIPLSGHEDAPEDSGLPRLESEDDSVYATQMSPDGQLLVSAGGSGWIIVRDPMTGAEEYRLPQLSSGIASITFVSGSSRWLVVGSIRKDCRIQIYDLVSRTMVREMNTAHRDWTSGLVYSEVNDSLYSVSGDGMVQRWDYESGEMREMLLEPLTTRNLHGVAIDPSNRWLAACGRNTSHTGDAHLWVWELKSQRLILDLQLNRSLTSRDVAFGNGGLLAAATDSGAVQLFNLEDGTSTVLESGNAEIVSLCFDPTGEVLATGDWEGVIRLWDVSCQRQFLSLEAEGRVFSLEFSSDGKTLFAGMDEKAPSDRRFLRWDLTRFDRHIAGNLEEQIRRVRARGEEPRNAAALRRWAEAVLSTDVSR